MSVICHGLYSLNVYICPLEEIQHIFYSKCTFRTITAFDGAWNNKGLRKCVLWMVDGTVSGAPSQRTKTHLWRSEFVCAKDNQSFSQIICTASRRRWANQMQLTHLIRAFNFSAFELIFFAVNSNWFWIWMHLL